MHMRVTRSMSRPVMVWRPPPTSQGCRDGSRGWRCPSLLERGHTRVQILQSHLDQDGYGRAGLGSKPGDKDGNWHNQATGESLRPDLTHGQPIGPHWDWKVGGQWYRIFPDGTIAPKTILSVNPTPSDIDDCLSPSFAIRPNVKT